MSDKKLTIDRYFSSENDGVYNKFEYEKTDVDIIDDNGKKLFVQKDVEFPKQWSPIARKIVASKYCTFWQNKFIAGDITGFLMNAIPNLFALSLVVKVSKNGFK